jgi:DNA-directed RNA polymerase subunit RPC12/RpoP
MLLVCSHKCGSNLFRALFAEVDIDSAGEFQDYRLTQPGYVCLNCGSPALDLAEVPAELDAEAREDEAAAAATAVTDILCPVCETMVQLDRNMECPNCGSPLEVA